MTCHSAKTVDVQTHQKHMMDFGANGAKQNSKMTTPEQLNDIMQYVRSCVNGRTELQETLLRSKVIDFADSYFKSDLTTKDYTMRMVIHRACVYFGITKEELYSICRLRRFVNARTFASVYIRTFLRLPGGEMVPLKDIGSKMKRHHSSIIHMTKRHNALIATCDEYRSEWNRFVEHLE